MTGKIKQVSNLIGQILRKLLVLSARRVSDQQESMWGIPTAFKNIYFALLALLCIPRFVMLYAEQAHRAAGEIWLAKHYILLGDVAKEFTPTAIGLAIILMLVIQAGGLVLSLYHMIANRWVTPVVEAHIAEGEAKGEARGRAEGKRKIRLSGKPGTNAGWMPKLRTYPLTNLRQGPNRCPLSAPTFNPVPLRGGD